MRQLDYADRSKSTGPVQTTESLIRSKRRWLFFIASCAAISLTASGLFAGRISAFRAGLHNDNPPFFVGQIELLAFAVWVVSLFAMPFTLVIRPDRKTWTVLLMAACLFALPTILSVTPSFHSRYQEGLARWIDDSVDTKSIGDWTQEVVSTTQPTSLVPTAWPAAIARLKPDEVQLLAARRGVEIRRGVEGTWGNARLVILLNDDQPFDAQSLSAEKRYIYSIARLKPRIYVGYCTAG